MLRPRASFGVLLALAACDASPYRTVTVETGGAAAARPAPAPADRPVLRFSVAAIESPRDTYPAYARLFEQMGQALDYRIEFEQRRTYREVNDLLIAGQLDASLLCTGGYLDIVKRAPRAVEVAAVPVVGGEASYRSVILVPASSGARDVRDLAGRRFAFTDELSFSGRLYALHLMRERGIEPDRFFASTIYSGSHDRSIEAVASGLVDGAAVHGGIFEQMCARDPSLRARVRVIHRSPPVGGMPVVVSTRLPREVREKLRAVLLALDRDPDGAAALRLLQFDRFTIPAPGFYASAAQLLDER